MITKEELLKIIDDSYDEFIQFSDLLYHHPALGFKEFENKNFIIQKLKEYGIEVTSQYCITGFSITIGSGKPSIGLLAELDAIPVYNHPLATNDDHCAHACGHSMQCSIMTYVLIALVKAQILNQFKGSVTLFYAPAEEFTDLDYRYSLIKEGKIEYLSGKQNMLAQHLFDNVDLIIHCHAMGDTSNIFNINGTLAGFIYKEFNFIGQESHAGALPYLGKNALNMFTLFQSAMGMLRETYKEEDMVRFHGIVTNGGQTVNSIPNLVTYQSYLRCAKWDSMKAINEKIENAAICCAKALQGDCQIKTINGYLPFIQDRLLSDVIYSNMLLFTDDNKIGKDEVSIASGDVGDLACFKPTIQFGYNGISGRIHGADFTIVDNNNGYILPAKVILASIYDLLENPTLVDNIVQHFKPTMSYQQYMDYLSQAK